MEHGSIARQPSVERRSIEVSSAIEDHSTLRIGPIVADTGEGVKEAFRPLAVVKHQLENYSHVSRAAPRRGPIKSACTIKNQRRAGVDPVIPSLK